MDNNPQFNPSIRSSLRAQVSLFLLKTHLGRLKIPSGAAASLRNSWKLPVENTAVFSLSGLFTVDVVALFLHPVTFLLAA